MNKRTIVLIGAHFSNNLGGPSVILGIMRVLREHLGDCAFIVANSYAETDQERRLAEHHEARYLPIPRVGQTLSMPSFASYLRQRPESLVGHF